MFSEGFSTQIFLVHNNIHLKSLNNKDRSRWILYSAKSSIPYVISYLTILFTLPISFQTLEIFVPDLHYESYFP